MRILSIVMICWLLAGCVWTRVSMKSHASEVESLHLLGMNYKDAMEKIRQAGFQCTWVPSRPFASSRAGGQVVIEDACWKRSAELACPQYRYVKFQYLPDDGKVVTVWPDITDQGCW